MSPLVSAFLPNFIQQDFEIKPLTDEQFFQTVRQKLN